MGMLESELNMDSKLIIYREDTSAAALNLGRYSVNDTVVAHLINAFSAPSMIPVDEIIYKNGSDNPCIVRSSGEKYTVTDPQGKFDALYTRIANDGGEIKMDEEERELN